MFQKSLFHDIHHLKVSTLRCYDHVSVRNQNQAEANSTITFAFIRYTIPLLEIVENRHLNLRYSD